jgi:hypothetical protein
METLDKTKRRSGKVKRHYSRRVRPLQLQRVPEVNWSLVSRSCPKSNQKLSRVRCGIPKLFNSLLVGG